MGTDSEGLPEEMNSHEDGHGIDARIASANVMHVLSNARLGPFVSRQ